jgi:hypothetical protein
MRTGSEVVFDFDPPPSLLQVLRGQFLPGRTEVIFDSSSFPSLLRRLRDVEHRMIVDWTRKNKNNGFRPSYFDPASLAPDLKRIGFADVQLFGPKEMNVRYCKDRTDGLRIQTQMHLVKARV